MIDSIFSAHIEIGFSSWSQPFEEYESDIYVRQVREALAALP